MLARLNVMQIGGSGAVELDEEGVGASPATRLPWDHDGVMKRLGAVTGYPHHGRGRHLVARFVALIARFNHSLHQPGQAQAFQQVLDNHVGIIQVQPLAKVTKGCPAPEVLPEAAACRQVHVAAISITTTSPGEEDGGILFGLIFVECPGSNKALAALLLYILLVELVEVVHLDR